MGRGVRVFAASLVGLIVLSTAGLANADDQIWTIALGHDWGGHEYIGEDGFLQGFTYDLISEVCKAAKIQCRTVWDKYTNCWDSEPGQHPFGGDGLMGGWYDACTGWIASVSRVQVYDFSMPFFPLDKTVMYIKKGRSSFQWDDIRNIKAMGFLDGWVHDEKCLARQTMIKGSILPAEKIKHYQTTTEVADALISGEVDAIFSGFVFQNDQLVLASTNYFTCGVAGNSMMTRKDNKFNSHWNRGFQQLVSSGKFRKLCLESRKEHMRAGDVKECV